MEALVVFLATNLWKTLTIAFNIPVLYISENYKVVVFTPTQNCN